MSSSARVDVILPNWNKAEYIEECLDSLVAQSFTNWRCIVVDGNSDDGSWEILQRYAQDDDRFELHQPGRQGLYPSWNYGLDQVRSPHFTFLTSDDVWSPDWLETAMHVLDRSPTSMAVSARPVYVDADTNRIGVPRLASLADELAQRYGTAADVDGVSVQHRPGPLQALMVYARKRLAQMRFADDVGSIADREWYLQMGLRGPVAYLRGCDVYLRQYDDQATAVTQRNRRKLAESVRTILNRNAEPLRRVLHVPSDLFYRADVVVRRMFDFLYMRPSVSMLRTDPLHAVSLLGKAVTTYPDLLLLEILSLLFGRTKYSMTQRVKAVVELMAHAPGTAFRSDASA